MKMKSTLLLLIFVLIWPAVRLEAATCNTSSSIVSPSPGFSITYDPSAAGNTTTSSYLTVDCTKTGANTANATYTVAANNGANSGGAIPNLAKSGAGNTIAYDIYQIPLCSTFWGNGTNGGTSISQTVSLVGTTQNQNQISYYGCISPGQYVPAGTYSDTVTMTLGGAAVGTGTFPVTITISAVCGLTPAPGTVAFTYTSFQGGASTASTTFSVTCNSSLPYTMALDATSGTLPATNLAYTLALSAASGTGSGVAQSYTINGNMAGGQSGTCALASCLDTQARTLTISY